MASGPDPVTTIAVPSTSDSAPAGRVGRPADGGSELRAHRSPSAEPATTPPDLDARINALLVECGRQEKAIYRGKGVDAIEALSFIDRVVRLLDGLCGVTSLDTYDDVIEALEDAV